MLQRNKQFDIMMLIGIIMVVMGHNHIPTPFPFYHPYTFHVPLFFFISGYFFRTHETFEEKKIWILHKFKNQFLMYFGFNVFFAIIDTAQYYLINGGFKSNMLYDFFITPFVNGHQYPLYIPAWFLLQLFVSNIFLQLLIWKKSSTYGWVLLILVFLVNLYTLQLGLKGAKGFELLFIRTVMSLFYMLLGYIFSKSEIKIKPIITPFYITLILIVVINLLNVHFGNITFSMVHGNIENMYVFAPLITSSLIILIVYNIANYISSAISENSFLLKIGQNSFHIMIWHLLIMNILKIIFVIKGVSFLGDFSTVYTSYNPKYYWLLYQVPAIVIPVIIVNYIKKSQFDITKFFRINTYKSINVIIIFAIGTLFISCTNNTLSPGDEIPVTGGITSNNRMFKLTLQEDGNLVLYNQKSEAMWASNSFGKPIDKCIFQVDGNLVLYDKNNVPYWASNTANYANSRLVLDNDGSLKIIYMNKVIWRNGKKSLPELHLSDSLISANNKFALKLQEDGNLVIFNEIHEPIWSTNTFGKPITKAIFQEDGNFVLYDIKDKPYWASNTSGHNNAELILENDGILKIIHDNKPIWSNK